MGIIQKLFSPTPQIRVKAKPRETYKIKSYTSPSVAQTNKLRALLSSPNTEIYRTLSKTRQLSRYMCENDSYAAKYLELTSVYVTGDDGIVMRPVVESRTGRRLDTVQKQILKEWERWTTNASLDGKFSWSELEQMGIQGVARDGEALFRIVVGKDVNAQGFALQPLDPALLDHEYNIIDDKTKNRIVMGVELDKRNRPVAYHFWTRYQDEHRAGTPRERERVPANEIIHIYDDPSGVQVRGLPWTTPALDQLVRLMEWQDDYSAGMKMAARTRLVLHNEGLGDEEIYDDISDDIVDNDADPDGGRTISYNEQSMSNFVNTTQSQILEVEAGKRLEALNIQLPTSGVSESAKLILQRIAAGLNVSYATLTSDGSKSSFSSVRHDSIVERDIWKQRQKWFISRFHQRVFKAWLETVVLRGLVELPSTVELKNCSAEWHPRGFSQIDPVKDLTAYILGIENGLLSRTQVAAMMGNDLKEVMQSIADERKMAEDLGIKFPEAQKTPAPQPPTNEEEVEEEVDETEDESGQETE